MGYQDQPLPWPTFNPSSAVTFCKKSILLFSSRICIQASGSRAMPTHIEYSSEPKEDEMTLNKSSYVSCGSHGDGVKASLCYSYRHAGDSFSVWLSAVAKSKENHDSEPGSGPGPRPFPL